MDINSLKHEVNYLVNLSYDVEQDFDIKVARRIFKEFLQLVDFLPILLERLKTTKAYTDIDLSSYENDLEIIYEFLTYVTRYKVKSYTGYVMFIKDVTSYNLILK